MAEIQIPHCRAVSVYDEQQWPQLSPPTTHWSVMPGDGNRLFASDHIGAPEQQYLAIQRAKEAIKRLPDGQSRLWCEHALRMLEDCLNSHHSSGVPSSVSQKVIRTIYPKLAADSLIAALRSVDSHVSAVVHTLLVQLGVMENALNGIVSGKDMSPERIQNFQIYLRAKLMELLGVLANS